MSNYFFVDAATAVVVLSEDGSVGSRLLHELGNWVGTSTAGTGYTSRNLQIVNQWPYGKP